MLIIRNHQPDAVLKYVCFDLKTGVFTTPTKEIMNRSDLKNSVFTHPILQELPLVPTKAHYYSYAYQDEETFCLALRCIYATLLQADHPALCSFHVYQAPHYQVDNGPYHFYFSCHPSRAAAQRLNVEQLSAMVTTIQNAPFQYCNAIFIDSTLTWRNLAKEMDADKLYKNTLVDPILPHDILLTQCELRFIHPQLGFGLFTRTEIKKGTLICEYGGQYQSKKRQAKNYCYLPGKTGGYHLPLDSKHYGNIARFVNHAPEGQTASLPILTANVEVENRHQYGMSRFVLVAMRDIEVGEQLLSSYGQGYFYQPEHELLFTKRGQIVDGQQRRLRNSRASFKRYLTVFATHGNRYALWLLMKRPILVVLGCVGLGLCLR